MSEEIDLVALKNEILSNKVRYKSSRDKIVGEPVSFNILQEEKDQIIDEYCNKKLSVREIGRLHSRPHSTISKLLKNNGITVISSLEKSRIYTINHNYFETIDCWRKAYWLGWLMSDGSVCRNGKEIEIRLQVRDTYIIEEFLKDIGCSSPVKLRKTKPTGLLLKCGKQKEYQSSHVKFGSAKMVLDLAKYGIIWNKGKRRSIPKNIPHDLFPAYLLGFFDGDGSVSISKGYKSIILEILDHEQTLVYLQRNITKHLGYEFANIFKRIDSDCYTLKFTRINDVKRFYKLIYNNYEFCLQRKKDKMESFFNHSQRISRTKTSIYIGVFKQKNMKKFTVRYSDSIIGYFANELEAARAYDDFVFNLLGSRANLNFPENYYVSK